MVVTTGVMITCACPDGWPSNNGNCYFVSTDELEQSDARSYCQASGGDLASISDSAEDSFIVSILYVLLSVAYVATVLGQSIIWARIPRI